MKNAFLISALTTSILLSTTTHAQIMTGFDPFDNMFYEFFNEIPKHALSMASTPRIDVADLKDKIEIKAELPGMDEKDIDLTCENGVLTIKGEKKQSSEEKDKNYYYKEISAGSFMRSIRLPKGIDETKIDAVFKNGILTINIPKKEITEEKPKKITIKKG